MRPSDDQNNQVDREFQCYQWWCWDSSGSQPQECQWCHSVWPPPSHWSLPLWWEHASAWPPHPHPPLQGSWNSAVSKVRNSSLFNNSVVTFVQFTRSPQSKAVWVMGKEKVNPRGRDSSEEMLYFDRNVLIHSARNRKRLAPGPSLQCKGSSWHTYNNVFYDKP